MVQERHKVLKTNRKSCALLLYLGISVKLFIFTVVQKSWFERKIAWFRFALILFKLHKICLSWFYGKSLKLLPHGLFFSHLWSKGWPHHGRTFSICLCPLSFWLTLPWWVLSTSWCCPSRLAVRGLPRLRAPAIVPCIISFSRQLPTCFLVIVWPQHDSFFALTVFHSSFLPYSCLVDVTVICFLRCPRNSRYLSQSFHLKRIKMSFFILSKCPAFTAVHCCRPY